MTTTKPNDEYLVPIEDLAGYLGGSSPSGALQIAKAAGVIIFEDWAGRPAVTPSAARKLRVANEEAAAERDRKDRAYRTWREAKQAEHMRRLREEAEKAAAEREQQIARASEEHRAELRRRAEQQAAARMVERAKYEPDVSLAAFERETGGR